MSWVSAVIIAASVALSLSIGEVRAECLERILACQSRCPDLQGSERASCGSTCRRIILCEVEVKSARGSQPGGALPDSALPPDILPKSSLPKSQLPDSAL